MDFIGWERSDFLLAVARAERYALEPATLARWHRLGLLPRPKTQPLGRGAGTRTWYPPGTSSQLRALIKIRRRTRKLSHVAWRLWWEGYFVDPRVVRKLLEPAAKNIDDTIRALSKLSRAERANIATVNISDSTARGARKRLGAANFPAFMNVIAKIAAGSQSYTDSEVALFHRGAGMDGAFRDKILGEGPLAQQDGSDLAGVAKVLGQQGAGSVLASSSDEDLLKARDQLKLFLTAFSSFGSVAQRSFAPRGFGLATLSRIVANLPVSVEQGLLLLWIGLGRLNDNEESVDQVLDAGRAWLASGAPSFEGIQALSREVPALAPLFSRKRLSAAVRSRTAQQRFLREVERAAAAHRAEIDAAMQRQPELVRLSEIP